jgi:hypothetical protein
MERCSTSNSKSVISSTTSDVVFLWKIFEKDAEFTAVFLTQRKIIY